MNDEINLLDYWRIIWGYKKMITGIVVVASVVAVFVSLMMAKTYKAEAVIVPISNKGGGMSALTAQLGGFAALAGLGVGGDDASKFMAILKSRTLNENVINNENLMPIIFEKDWNFETGKWKSDDPKKQPTMEAAVAAIKNMVTIIADKKDGTIRVSCESKSPELSARIANAYLSELQKFVNDNALTMSKRNRIFIEEQLAQNKEELLEAGKEINEFYKGGRVSNSEAKVDVRINDLKKNRKSVGEAQSDEEPQKLQNTILAELDGILIQKADIEKKITDAKMVKDVPQQVYLTYLMMRRELLAKMNAMLVSQYEMSKIEEAKEDLAFQIIDKAVPPLKKFKPKSAQICMMAFISSLFLAVFLAFFMEYLKKMRANPLDK